MSGTLGYKQIKRYTSLVKIHQEYTMLQLRPRQLLLLSLFAGLLTMALKTLAWYLTGSVGFLSDAMESLVNVAGAGFALWMVTIANRPADKGHPFGHSKAEYFSAAFEGGMIFIAAIAINSPISPNNNSPKWACNSPSISNPIPAPYRSHVDKLVRPVPELWDKTRHDIFAEQTLLEAKAW